MVSAILSRLVILVFGTLYPAYASYKAVRTKNVKEYVKWMMYWIVFALFCAVETFSDFFLSWFPFYYEFKIIFVLWMLSPITQGSSFLFKKFVHPQLARREKDIDEMIDQATKQGYSTFVDLGNKGFKVILKSVIMGQSKLVDHLRRSYSTSDLSNDGHDIMQRREVIGDQEDDKEDELDNRLLEDQAELARRSTSVNKSRGSSSALSLSSVKEEEVEDGERTTTETFTIPSSTRRHYSVREDKSATCRLRCHSLPPFADRFTKPLVIASTNLESKREYFAKFQSVEKKEIISNPSPQVSSMLNEKRRLLSRSLSQDSGTAKMLNTISSHARSSARKARGADLSKALLESRETIKEHTFIKSDNVYSKQTTSDNQSHSSLRDLSSENLQEKIEPEVKQDGSDGNDRPAEECKEEDIRFTRRSIPRFQNDLPAIDETAPLIFAQQPVIIDTPEVFFQHSAQIESTGDSQLLQDFEDNTGNQNFNLFAVDTLGDDLSNLIFLDVEDDLDDQCPTPTAKDSPPNLSQDQEKIDSATGGDSNYEINAYEEDSTSKESDNSSVSEFGSFHETDIETCSEGSNSSLWETLSEASATDSTECHKGQASPTLKDEAGPWSAPSSPASFIRGSKYEEDETQSWNTPSSLIIKPSSSSKIGTSWVKSSMQSHMSLPNTTSRNILYSWPSPSRISDSASSYRARDKLSSKSYGHSFDPFQTWHPSSRSGTTSYQSSSISSSSSPLLSKTYSSLSDRRGHSFVRSASMDTAGGEAVYGRYLARSYNINPLSSRTHSRLRSNSFSLGRFSTYTYSHSPANTYRSYTTKK